VGLLDGKTALVTGGGRGIGRGIARAMAAAGARVMVNDLGTSLAGQGADAGPAAETVAEIVAAGGIAVANTDSVTDFDRAAAMVRSVVDRWGRLDVLVNCAGILRDRMLFNMTEAEWDAVIAVHLKGAFNTMRAAVEIMRQQRAGRIVNMSSVSAFGSPGQPNYGAAKAGILGLTWSAAAALGRYGVTVNAVLPSGATRMMDETAWGREAVERTGRRLSETAAGTPTDPDNVAPLVVFLASDAACDVNGQAFHSWGYGYTLVGHPEPVRRIDADRRLPPEELAELAPKTLTAHLTPPPGFAFGIGLDARPAGEWNDLADGVRLWQSPREPA
jgi:NAD(P)-dependent dehydrogenase (short-subunit alcohol dehydrogenase family)